MSEALALKGVLSRYGHTVALLDGQVPAPGIKAQFAQVEPLSGAFPEMLACEPRFDLCEVALGPYLLARSMGKPVAAIPVILTRDFQHSLMLCRKASGIDEPADLEGRRVGCRFYCQTSAIWTRGILATEYGVDLARVTWVSGEQEPVEGTACYPDNVELQSGHNLDEMLLSGEVDAVVGTESPACPTWPRSFLTPATPRSTGTGGRPSIRSTTPWCSEHRYWPITRGRRKR